MVQRKCRTAGRVEMKLRDTAEVWFSELEDNWEECDFFWFSRSLRNDDRYRRYGDLPDGSRFGTAFIPASGDPWEREAAIVIVGEDGELQRDTPSWTEEGNSSLIAMAGSPDGRCLAWITADSRLGVWNRGKEDFTDWDGKCLNERLGDRTISDVKLHADGILEIECRGEETAGYLCAADSMLEPWKNGWVPGKEECRKLSHALKNGLLRSCPDSLFVRICRDDGRGEYKGCGVKHVLLDEGLERIEGEILADNPDLETVVIPASVLFADRRAFGGCTGLKHLVIEGDLFRVKQWDKDAFEGCPCAEYYALLIQGTESSVRTAIEQCGDDNVLYSAACYTGSDPKMISNRDRAARLIQNRDYQYALSSHITNRARTAMILNLYDSLEGDELFIAKIILTDPNDENKAHMMLYCEDENLLMLGWKYVYGARKLCRDRLHTLGSRFPEAYEKADPQEKAEWEEMWMISAGETALDLISEDREVRERTSGAASVDSEPLHLYLALQHPRKAIRWWHAKKLKNPAFIAYAGSWTGDDEIKEALSVRINSTELITEMLFGDLSGADLVLGFRKPEDLTLQDRFCIAIMKNHPDPEIREHVRTELLRGNAVIPGTDLTKPDPLYKK